MVEEDMDLMWRAASPTGPMVGHSQVPGHMEEEDLLRQERGSPLLPAVLAGCPDQTTNAPHHVTTGRHMVAVAVQHVTMASHMAAVLTHLHPVLV